MGTIGKAVQCDPVRLLYNHSLSLPMKKRFIILGLLAVPVIGFVGLVGAALMLPSSETPNTTKEIAQTKPVQLTKSGQSKPFGPWLTTLQKVTSHGQKMKDPLDEDKTIEAAGQWVTAHIQIQNTSKSRQSLKDLFLWTAATIIDGKGTKKDADANIADTIKIIELEEKPFKPGEVRTVPIRFDIPEGSSIQRLDLPSVKSEANIKVFPAQ